MHRRWRPSLSHWSRRETEKKEKQIIKMYFQFVFRDDFIFFSSVSNDRCPTKRTTHQLLARLSHCKYDFDCFWILPENSFFSDLAQIEKNSNG